MDYLLLAAMVTLGLAAVGHAFADSDVEAYEDVVFGDEPDESPDEGAVEPDEGVAADDEAEDHDESDDEEPDDEAPGDDPERRASRS